MTRYLLCIYLLFSVGCDWPIGTPKPLGPTPDCGDSYLTEDETCDDGNDVTELCDYGATECMVLRFSLPICLGPYSVLWGRCPQCWKKVKSAITLI